VTQQAIRGALQVQLLTLGWADQTAFEGKQFTPTAGVPYQQVDTIFAEPNTYGVRGEAQERGVFQVTLKYPTNSGAGVSGARAEAIRTAFAPVQTFGGVVKISRKAEIKRLPVDGDRDVTVVRIRFGDR
jgi:hypothetical protein